MADLSDTDLVAELNYYGENISLPIKAKQRPILVKKLNHLRVRDRKQNEAAKPQVSKQAGTKRSVLPNSPRSSNENRYQPRYNAHFEGSSNLDALSSDESDVEVMRDVRATTNASPQRGRPKPVSDGVLRTLRRRTSDRRSTDHNEQSFSGQSSSSKGSFNGETPSPSPTQNSRLYPDLNSFTSRLTQDRRDETFESSDSDGDLGSSYYVVNKSINTSFPLPQSDRESLGSRRRSFLPSPGMSTSVHQTSMTHSPPGSTRGLRASSVQPYVSRFSDILPKMLIGLVVVFFAALSVTYVSRHKDVFFAWFSTSSHGGIKDNLLLCDGELHQGCYGRPEIQKAIVYIQELFDELSMKKGKVICEQEAAGSDQINTAVLRMKIDRDSVSETQSERQYQCCLKHILANPHWNIRALKSDGTEALSVDKVAKLESVVASMTFWCRLQRSVESVLYGIFVLLAVIGVSILLYKYMKYRVKAKQKEQADVFLMVERIIEILQDHHNSSKVDNSSDPPYLAIQHVHDELIPPARRRELNVIWTKAVQFIATNESRVRLEQKTIRGEKFEVWYWLQPSQTNGKIWQGLAFNESSSSSNEVIYSPTPCLKIRNMFDSAIESEENWEDGVVDAVLEKCSHLPSIVHAFVDTDSKEGCVYLKCSSCETAGKVRKALNSWWFDGRLVTVKHMKSENYHKRWPEARNAKRPLRPSTNLMRSISEQMYPSSLERT